MNFNLGLVGHPDINLKIKKIIEKHFNSISLYVVDVVGEEDLNRGVKKIKRMGRICNGILYTARDIHDIFNSRVDHTIPNTYVENTRTDLFKALFHGTFHLKTDIKRVSIDSLSHREVTEAYSDLGIDGECECHIKIVPTDYSQKGFLKEVLSQHMSNYKYDGSLCITQITAVRDALVSRGIKAILLEAQREQIIERVNNLISRSSAIKKIDFDQVAITINISNLKENLIINNSHHSVILEYNRIMEEVFWFAERVDGAYSFNGSKSYTIFCNREGFERETDHSSRLNILDTIAENQIVYASIGIGYGRTFKEAIKHSVIASIKAEKAKRNCAYISDDPDRVTGPLLPSNETPGLDGTVYDARLEKVASRSSINIDTIYKINSALRAGNNYTSSEVAQIIGVTRRSANRILAKLEENGFAESTSSKPSGRRGRPSRIIRFLF